MDTKRGHETSSRAVLGVERWCGRDPGMERTVPISDVAPLDAVLLHLLQLNIKDDAARTNKEESASTPTSDVDGAAMDTSTRTSPVEVKSPSGSFSWRYENCELWQGKCRSSYRADHGRDTYQFGEPA